MMMNNSIRILVVDDDPKWRDDTQKNLERWGYTPVIAHKFGRFLMAEAVELCFKHSCHIALIDMNLFSRPDNRDGFKLVNALKPATPIIVTGYHSRDAMHEALADYHVFRFIGKDEGPNSLKRAIANAIEKKWQTVELKNENTVEINWPANANIESINLIRRFQQNGVDDLLDDAIIKALRVHFNNAKSVTLESWDRVNESESLDLNRRGRSAVFKADVVNKQGKLLRPFVIKIARRKRVEREKENFDSHIDEHINPQNYARVSRMTAMWHIGIVQYDYAAEASLGGEGEVPMGTFKKFFLEEDIETIEALIQKLFGTVWKGHLDDKELLNVSIFHGYDSVWSSNSENRSEYLLKKLSKFLDQSDYGDKITINGIEVPNPIQWIVDQVSESPSAMQSSAAVTHGDLHSGNILISDKKEPILIDFERAGIGPIYQDFTLLSVDILLSILSGKVTDLEQILIFLSTVWRKWNCPKKFRPLLQSQSVQKGIRSIEKIRKIAFDVERNNFKKETNFLWGLLLNVGFRAALLQKLSNQAEIDEASDVKIKKVDKTELDSVLLLGGLICRRLEETRKDEPPSNILKWLEDQPAPSRSGAGGESLPKAIGKVFSLSELREACFELGGIDFDDMRSSRISEFIIEFLKYMGRYHRRIELKNYLKTTRPNIDWDRFDWFEEE